MQESSAYFLKSVSGDLAAALGGLRPGRLARPQVYFPLLVLALFIVVPPYLSRYYLHILVIIFLFTAASEAWNIIGGYGGQFSLGHAAYFGLGAYTSTLLFHYFEISPWLGMLLGAGLSVLLSWGIGWLCFRLQGPYFVISTIALTEVLRFIFLNQRWVTMGATGLSIKFKGHSPWLFQFGGKLYYYYIALGLALIVIYVTYKIAGSRLGQYLVALGQNQAAAEAVGVDSVAVKRAALSVSAFFTALCGTFYAQYTFFIDPDTVSGLPLSIEIALCSIIGGVGTLWGPVIGAFLLRLLTEYTSAAFGAGLAGIQLVIYGALLMIMVLIKPEGLAPLAARAYQGIIAFLPGGREKGAGQP
jgi:branched-chain amino acid transport system permease protein